MFKLNTVCDRSVFANKITNGVSEFDVNTISLGDVETFSEDRQELWVTSGHVFCASKNRMTVVSKRLPSNSSFSSQDFNLNLQLNAEVLNICTNKLDTYPPHQICLIVLVTGEVQVYRFNLDDNLWVEHCVFELGNETNESNRCIKSVLFNQDLTFVTWCETETKSALDHSVYYQPVSFDSSHTILVNAPIQILNHCPMINLACIGSLISCLPVSSHQTDIFMVWSMDKNLSLLNTEGQILFRSKRINDFTEILISTIGLWNTMSATPIFQTLNLNHRKMYILTTKMNILVFHEESHHCHKISLASNELKPVLGFAVYANVICIFTNSAINIFNLQNGEYLESIKLLSESEPILNVWHSNTFLTMVGYYTKCKIYQLWPLSTIEILNHKNPKLIALLNINPDWVFLSHLNAMVNQKKPTNELNTVQISLQSEALLLALLQNARDSVKSGDAKYDVKDSVRDPDRFIGTKLNRLLAPLVDSFNKLERGRLQLFEN